MGWIAQEEDAGFLFAVDDLAGVIAQGGLGDCVWPFSLCSGCSSWIFKIVFLRGGEDGLEVEGELMRATMSLSKPESVEPVMNIL